MPDHEDSLGGETFSGEEQQDPAEQSLGDGATMGGDTAAHSLGDQSTFGDANVDDELFDDGMELVDLSTRYTEEGVLGKGGMGEVILATDTRLGRKVAIKRILGKAARSKTAVARFLTEAKSMAELSHPNIVQIHDYGRSVDGPFLIMECVQGGSLLEKCKAGPIELDEAVNIFGQLCDGLSKAHAAGIIHRDIKPANVLMTEDGVPKLTDFGLAKDDTADTGMTMEGAVIGTLDFMPPEQRQAAELTDHRSDLWSLAATFYQMLTGKSPKVINISAIPPELQSVVAKALEESKEDRFQSAMEMREAMLQAHSGKMDTSRSLEVGECPECATRNPSDRKFCRECSGELQVSCLKCEQDMAIWDKGCGECGAQQQPLVKKKFNQLQTKHNDAERFLQELNFEEAETAASAIAAEKDSRLQNFHIWHEEFSQRLVDTRKTEHERLEELLEEAKTHEDNYDYEVGLKSLAQIAPALLETSVKGMVDNAKELTIRLTEKHTKLKKLEKTVREKITKRQFDGMLPFLNELIALKPGRPDVEKLRSRVQKLKVKSLRQTIAAAIKKGELSGLLYNVDECLNLNSDQDDLINLKVKLTSRHTELCLQRDIVLKQVKPLLLNRRFEEAKNKLLFIPPEVWNTEVRACITQAEPNFTSKDFQRDLLNHLLQDPFGTNFDGASGSCYVGNKMPSKKLDNIKKVFSLEPQESIVAFIDCTVFGSAKDFIAITDRGIIGKKWGYETRIYFDELISCELAVSEYSQILITKHGGRKEVIRISGSGLPLPDMLAFFQKLQNKIICLTNNASESAANDSEKLR